MNNILTTNVAIMKQNSWTFLKYISYNISLDQFLLNK